MLARCRDEYSLIIWLDVIIPTLLPVHPLCCYSHSAQGLAGRGFLNESKWKCQAIIAPPAERKCSQSAENSVNNLLQFLASVGVSAGLCCSLIELAPDSSRDKTNKVASRHSPALWSQSASHGLSSEFDLKLHDIDFKQLKSIYTLSALSHFSKPYSNIACLEDILPSYRN